MKTNFTRSIFCGLALFLASASLAQIPPGQAGKFGIDGDIMSDTSLSAGITSGSHDWFKKKGGTGVGLFDTTGSAALKKRIGNGENVVFSRKMQYPRYSVQDGDILMDAAYSRDFMGLSSGPLLDRTVFYTSGQYSNKLYQDPATWKTVPTGDVVPSKTDIIDTYVNMRRNGSIISGANPSHIMLNVAATTLSTDGTHYLAFILSRTRMNYDSLSGAISNAGPSTQGGHSAWFFSNDGSVKDFGDMAISFEYGSAGVANIQLLIWTDFNSYNKLNPTKFDFVSGQWYGTNSNSGWGWAGITRNAGAALQAWGATNSIQTGSPLWGTSSKDLGTNANSYAASGYSAYQFGEAAIDLTSAGVDFSLSSDFTACNPPYTRYFVVTRSASGFGSAMQDFTGPYEFLDAPTVPADVLDPGPFTCATNTALSLGPASAIKGAYYSWFTPDGNISQSNQDSSAVKISKPGTYILTAAMAQGCATQKDTIMIGSDYNKPVAKAYSSGLLSLGGTSTLFGGDPVASNYQTPYGGSAGLSYRWTGPAGFPVSTLQNPVTSLAGTYTLTVTELRNGCTATASTLLSLGTVLPVKFTNVAVTTDPQKKTNTLSWKVANLSNVEKFVVEKSSTGTNFSAVSNLVADNKTTDYSLKDNAENKTTYYRVRAVEKSGAETYSSIVRAESSNAQLNSFTAYSDGSGNIVVNLTAPAPQTLSLALVNLNGQVMKKLTYSIAAGNNTFKLDDLASVSTGIYLLQAQNAGGTLSIKIRL